MLIVQFRSWGVDQLGVSTGPAGFGGKTSRFRMRLKRAAMPAPSAVKPIQFFSAVIAELFPWFLMILLDI